MPAPAKMVLQWSFWLLLQVLLAVAVTSDAADKDMPTKPLWNATWTDKLKRDLLLHYDKFARPAQHTNTTLVTVDLTLRHIELDELKSTMTVHGWVKMFWVDEKLRWNDTDYGNLGVLHLADHEIWQPDIVLYNSATGNSVDHYGNTHCLAHPDGSVLWVPPTQFIAFCDLDLRLWPFDTQVCQLKLGSWTYDGDQVDLQLDEHGADSELLVTNTEWQLMEVTDQRNVIHYACCAEPYIDVTYFLTLKRRSPTYSAIVVTPATVIVLMTLAIFWLPPTAGEKLILSGCTALIICLFLLFFSQKLPAMAGNTPLVVLFYSSSLYLVCLSMVVSVAVINIARFQHVATVPWIVKNSLTGWLGRALGLGPIIGQVSLLHHGILSGNNVEELREHQPVVFDDIHNEEHQMIADQSHCNAANQQDWILVAAAIDRISFFLYCILFAILAIVYSV